ncbi:MAG: polysaccharide biosynthesis/export family protein [Hahellaceae bacterium]|nr:polysaccharide biosynthesis/export family protein [Hahellaceae bacterium]
MKSVSTFLTVSSELRNQRKSSLTKSAFSSAVFALLLSGCANQAPQLPQATLFPSVTTSPANYNYLIGPYDSLEVFVWGNPEITGSVEVRPDGKISTKLVEDIPVAGKTPTQVARDIEKALSQFIRDPIVTVIPSDFLGPYSEQVRVIGEAANPRAISYAKNMTLLDVMIQVGGISEFAAGNRATLVRVMDTQQKEFGLRIDDLVRDGDISANVDILPGDIIIIPESWF